MTDDIDRMLEQSLAEDFDQLGTGTPLPTPRYAPVATGRGGFRRRLRFGVPLVLGTNMLVGLSVVTIAAASVGAKTVVTGSPNPLVWGHRSAQVSPSSSPDDHGRRGRSPASVPTSTSHGTESPDDHGGHGPGSDDGSPQPSSDSRGDGGSEKRGSDDSATPASGGGGGQGDYSSPSPSHGPDG